ncbi:hypothetical protein ACFWBF_33700, partial [Streptomyces sp. NPDC060028]
TGGPSPAPEQPVRPVFPSAGRGPQQPVEARAARPERTRRAAAAPAPEETTVHITIGRLEIRSGPPRTATAAEAAANRRPPRRPAVPLEDYLRRRSGGAR